MKLNEINIHHHYVDPAHKAQGSEIVKSNSLKAKNVIDKISS